MHTYLFANLASVFGSVKITLFVPVYSFLTHVTA